MGKSRELRRHLSLRRPILQESLRIFRRWAKFHYILRYHHRSSAVPINQRSLGAEMSGGKAIVFDSLAGSISHGIQVLMAARMAESGAKLGEIVEALEEYRKT